MMKLSATTHLWLAARSMLLERGDDLFRRWERACRSFDLDDIHDLRVSSRRVREALALFAPCFPKKSLSRVSSQIKRLTNMLGVLRNTDEAMLFFTSVTPAPLSGMDGGLGRLFEELRKERDKERKSLKIGMRKLDPGSLKTQFSETCNRPLVFSGTKVDPFVPIRSFLVDAVTGHEAAVNELLPRAVVEENVGDQHRLRIVVKRFRYRVELAAPLASAGFSELQSVFKGYQDLLGRLHDLDVFGDLVRNRLADIDTGPLLALIAGQRHERFNEFERLLASDPLAELGGRVRGLL